MPRRKSIVLCGIAAVVLAGSVTTLGAVVKHEPNFYRQKQVPPGDGRRQLALECVTSFQQMDEDKKAKKADWGCDASEAQMNSFFSEVFGELGQSEDLRKLGISSPCVLLEDNQFRLAFRYDTGWFSTIISYNLKVWLVTKEPNMIAVEFLSARAGALPISSQAILTQLCEAAKKQDFKVNLFRHEGNSVAVVQLRPNENHPTWLLTALQVGENKVSIRGKTPDHAQKPLVIKTPTSAQ